MERRIRSAGKKATILRCSLLFFIDVCHWYCWSNFTDLLGMFIFSFAYFVRSLQILNGNWYLLLAYAAWYYYDRKSPKRGAYRQSIVAIVRK